MMIQVPDVVHMSKIKKSAILVMKEEGQYSGLTVAYN